MSHVTCVTSGRVAKEKKRAPAELPDAPLTGNQPTTQ
jgi:hypothetical protein